MAQIIAVEYIGVHRTPKKLLLERARDGRLAGAGKSREPDDRATVLVARGAPLCCDLAFAPENILALDLLAAHINRAGNNAATYQVPFSCQDKPAQDWNALVVIEDKRRSRLQSYIRHFVDA